MPAELVDDATQWLRNRGAPLTAKNLNAAQAYLAENPEARPSYAEAYADGTYTARENIPDIDIALDNVIARTERAPPRPVMPGRKPVTTATDEPEQQDNVVEEASEDASTDTDTDMSGPTGEQPAQGSTEPSLGQPAGLDTRTMSSGEEQNARPDNSMSVDPTAVGAGVGVAAALATELKKAYDSGMNDNWVREGFAKNIKSRTAKAGGPTYPSTMDAVMDAVRSGDMRTARDLISTWSPEEQKALRSIMSNPPPATMRAPTGAQRVMTSDPARALIDVLSRTFARGRKP